MALRAKLSFERHIIFEISLREISKMMCLSKDNLALHAKFKFETDVFFMILLRKIMKNSIYLAGRCPKK